MGSGRHALGFLGSILLFLFLLVQIIFWGGTSLGVVHEHCLDSNASQASGQVVVDSHWTYILWPPLFFAAADPAGRCVRNTPLREGLDAIGIWSLPSPEQQVHDHIESQLQSGR
ncbi:MAG: hypothetical protein ACRDMH_00355 [Solirubrobacterales bacterium]